MGWLATTLLVLWMPIVFVIFERYPTQKAIVVSFISAWLFLPPIVIFLPGVPDWSKMTATTVSVMICVSIKKLPQLLTLRFRYYDLPVLVFCLCPFVSSVTSNEGVYDGLSAALEEVFRWGLPYLIGRVYLSNPAGNRQLCLGIAVGGMVYVPFCLFEIRFSPMLKSYVYGIYGNRAGDFGLRYGGYRPLVFLSTGIELGWWMCCSTFAAYMLWKSGSLKKVSSFPMTVLTPILTLVTISCKSTGALIQLAIGLFLVHVTKRINVKIFVYAFILIGPIYCIARPTGLWTGETLVHYSDVLFGPERAQSLAYRFEQEDILMRTATQRLLFGWARNGGFNPPDREGRIIVTDGLWLIVFGWAGSVGLVSLNGMLLLPTLVFMKRYPPRTWLDPDVAPVTTLALILPLYMLDNLSNAMLNPIYAIAMGSVSGCFPASRMTSLRRTSRPSQTAEVAVGIDEPTPKAASLTIGSGRADATDSLEDLALAAWDQRRTGDACDLMGRSIRSLEVNFQSAPSLAWANRLGRSHIILARFLTSMNQRTVAIKHRQLALTTWDRFLDQFHDPDFTSDLYSANLNDLAWLFISERSSDIASIQEALGMAEQIVEHDPGRASFWNTLGIARYRNGEHHKAIYSLIRSVELSDEGGSAFDFYFLALANHGLGYAEPAVSWFEQAELWCDQHPELQSSLRAIKAEARHVLGVHDQSTGRQAV